MRRATLPLTLGLLLASAALPACGGQDPQLGKRPEALAPCDELAERGRLPEANQCYSGVSTSGDAFSRAEAWWALGDLKRANEVFRAAIEAEPKNPELRVRWGYLYLQTHNESEALNLFNEALEIDEKNIGARLGVATVYAERFEGKAKEIVDRVLEEQPEQVKGYLLRAQMLLEEKDLAKADEALDTALEMCEKLGVAPTEAYALKASEDLIRGVTDSEWTKRALDYNPTYGEIYSIPAHYYVITRRYREAAELLQKAVELNPRLSSAQADLGVNLLRENKEDEGRRRLEIAFEGDPFSAKTVNSLRLLDSFENFRTFSSRDMTQFEDDQDARAALEAPEIIVRLHKKEADLLRPYVIDLAEKSVASFSKKYGFMPQRPIHVELYPDHDDFAVRTMGMPGIGLLGVTFGYLVAMDSPSGRSPGTFHWGTTLWHEMAHVFTLEATDHLVPRWYSEGISMYEEWEARPNWGEPITPDFVMAFNEGKLLPVADLDKGFIRPSYPNQIAVSYFQAGLVCQMIDREWGPEKLVEILNLYGKEASTPEAIRQALGVEPEEFDKRFREFLIRKLGPLADDGALKLWREELKEMLTAAKASDWDKVIPMGRKLEKMYPGYVEAGSPYLILADAYEEKGERTEAIAELQAYLDRGGRSPERLKKLADWYAEAGEPDKAIAALDEVLYVWPADEQLHVKMGDLLLEKDRPKQALREYQAALAMDPLDKAAAHFRLAETYYTLRDSEKARRHVLLSLEAAPSFRPAQKLLLELTKK
ncbi:MAG: tetratricopeptide repeat protein [Bryobacterales bacterium]|nr:tetratricopeptide repeat protein [Bryobacterales bacterium]